MKLKFNHDLSEQWKEFQENGEVKSDIDLLCMIKEIGEAISNLRRLNTDDLYSLAIRNLLRDEEILLKFAIHRDLKVKRFRLEQKPKSLKDRKQKFLEDNGYMARGELAFHLNQWKSEIQNDLFDELWNMVGDYLGSEALAKITNNK